MVPPAYVTPIRQGGSISRIGYVSDMDTHQIRDGYVSMEYWKKINKTNSDTWTDTYPSRLGSSDTVYPTRTERLLVTSSATRQARSPVTVAACGRGRGRVDPPLGTCCRAFDVGIYHAKPPPPLLLVHANPSPPSLLLASQMKGEGALDMPSRPRARSAAPPHERRLHCAQEMQPSIVCCWVPGFFLVTAGSLVGGARDKVCVPGWEAKDRWAGPFYGLFSNYRSTNLLFFSFT
jgi:hypothetical protein